MIKTVTYLRKQIFLAIVLLIVTLIVSCNQHETLKADALLSASHASILNTPSPISNEIIKQPLKGTKDAVKATLVPTVTFTPAPPPSILGTVYDPTLDLHAGPVPLPLEIEIPILDVKAPILGVGLTKDNNMDAPKGPYGDPNWSSAFWYRGSAIPGDPGTTTIAGHVNGMLGEPETFARIRRLKPGDLIIINVKNSDTSLYFVVDEVKKYSMAELIQPEIDDRIFGGNMGADGKRLSDGTSHLTLITCTGYYKDGEFDHRIVVFSTLR